MQKMSPVASKLSELWQFLYTKVTWNLNFTQFWNLEISLNFRDRRLSFCMWALNLYLNNMSTATWGFRPLYHWFLRGGGALTIRATCAGIIITTFRFITAVPSYFLSKGHGHLGEQHQVQLHPVQQQHWDTLHHLICLSLHTIYFVL